MPSLASARARPVGLAVALIGLLLIGWGLGEVARSGAQPADLDLVRDVAAERTSLLTAIAHGFSFVGSGLVILPLAAACCALLYRRGVGINALAIAVSTGGGILIPNVDKLLVGRPRPPVHHLELVRSSSFPSGHAAQASAFYLALLIAVRMKQPLLVVAVAALVLGVALSRVYLGVHYPTDVAAGVLLGAAWTLIVAALLRQKVSTDTQARGSW